MKILYTIRSAPGYSTVTSTSSSTPPPTTVSPTGTQFTVLSTKQTTPLPTVINPQLPFFLFASDQVAEIDFSESPCVFVQTSTDFDVSGILFTPKYANGSLGEGVSAASFIKPMNASMSVLFGKHCFDSATLLLDYGSTFDPIDENSEYWRSTVFYFMSKAKAEGVCAMRGPAGGNVYSFNSELTPQSISVHAECPAVILASTGFKFRGIPGNLLARCPQIGINPLETYSLPAHLKLVFSNVRSGLDATKADLSLFSLTQENALNYNGETLLTSAITIASNRSVWSEKVLPVSGVNGLISGQTCDVDRNFVQNSQNYDGLIITFPYSNLQVDYMGSSETFDVPNPEITVIIDKSYFACAQFTLQWHNLNFEQYDVSINQSTGVTTFGDPSMIGFSLKIERKDTVECKYAFMKIPYTVRSSNLPTTTSSQSTVSSSQIMSTIASTATRGYSTLQSTSPTSPATPSTTLTTVTSTPTLITPTTTTAAVTTTSKLLTTPSTTTVTAATTIASSTSPAVPPMTSTTRPSNSLPTVALTSTVPITTTVTSKTTSPKTTASTSPTIHRTATSPVASTMTIVSASTVTSTTTSPQSASTVNPTVTTTPKLSSSTAPVKTTSETPLKVTTVTATAHETTTPKGGNSMKNSILPRILCSVLVILYFGV